MEQIAKGLATAGNMIEWVLWSIIYIALLFGLGLRVGAGIHAGLSWFTRHSRRIHHPQPHVAALLLVGVLVTVIAAVPASVTAGQGWWWGSPINPGFDRNTVIQVAGTATQLNIGPPSGPCTLHLETAGETFIVMLGPGWYITAAHVDIRSGDRLSVEGSKMMDRQGNLHLVAARIVNQRTNAVILLRDDNGRPVWRGEAPEGSAGRRQP